ncbi:MAG TPA: hypothetical protein VGM12_06620 [Trebonia sp.]|jgi:hypothetical protein
MPLHYLATAVGGPPVFDRITVDGAVFTAAALEEIREALCLVRAEADDGARLPPRFFKRVAHISDNRLSRRLPYPLERSPTLPGGFQAGGRMLCTCDQLWITHRAIPLIKSVSARI